ncbi:MAG: bifunctional 23S rRNA (guanine(2069)-N(7))-methyltransferase RlmK/23S rRNA (guanine(2445)-N(2))-methyltransferase RlmL [Gammaproteobacteria bacterium]|nr:bifunctional 23S rRNA (guanine(2069)-N(7))-methyltransferase RlmK/23S rRNA (guanine(2445)-N(2))-methyltransferase RlmL [Gammaproteobacteria bacterium]MCF6229905.1 bifunctional 23S rRNA (guanine(2069)-N(7))-methyltransferase RlmK/23S rRNA (guanine(2445)-N(2))-methyltransferase RlmL [Gammaproteobacteria bacterium]
MPEALKLFASTPKGMEQLLADEIKQLGGFHMNPVRAGVEFTGTLETAYKLCLWSRVANRVLLSLPSFEAKTPEALYEGIQRTDWSKQMSPEGTLAVDFNISRSKINHSHYAALKVKDAVVDQFRDKYDLRPSVDTEYPDLRINCYLAKNICRLSIDLSGDSLHRRGYRLEGGGAPLKENLAAAILLLAGWPAIAAEGGSLVDPMCGSATLLIEGAMMAADIAPGLLRSHFGFTFWKQHDPILWASLLAEAEQRRELGLATLPAIQGFDIDGKMISIARANIERAGLQQQINVTGADITQAVPADLPPGLVVTNPPYGERLGGNKDLSQLYRQLGSTLNKAFSDWRSAIFTGLPKMASYTGLYPETKETLFNGTLQCVLLCYGARKSELSKALDGKSEGAPMLANRLNKNRRRLANWLRREEISCYRLYDADLPEYALAIDLYQGDRLWVNVQEYQAPASIDPAKAAQRLRDALHSIKEVLDISNSQLFLKQRRKQKGSSQYERYDQKEQFHTVTEGPIKCLVNLSDYLDSGLFLDHRLTRRMIGEMSRGKRFLNLFAYTGVATLYAAAGGASETRTIDMSNTYIAWAQRNMELNGFTGAEHNLLKADCLEWIKQEFKQGGQYDLIFLDPPSFSNSKRMEQTFDVLRDHVALIDEVSQLLSDGGTLIFSNNNRKFKMDHDALPALEIIDMSAQTIPEDFKRNQKIHNCWRITRKGEE